MARNALIGTAAFGVTEAVAGYLWTVFEFPFAIVLPGIVGWYAVTRPDFGNRKALWAGMVGGLTFTALMIAAFFFAITDGSPVPLPASVGALIAAAGAGALAGWLLERGHGALAMAGFSAAGMLAAMVLMTLMQLVAPASIDVEGPSQYAYFALNNGLAGAAIGAVLGAGTAWLSTHPVVGKIADRDASPGSAV
jgi:hypothetical protein